MSGPWNRRRMAAVVLLAAVSGLVATRGQAQVPTPEEHFGFRMGAEGRLAGADEIERYLASVAARSDRVTIVDIGATTDGHRTPAALVSSPANIRDLERIRAANQRLADPRRLSPDDARQLAMTQKAVVAIGASIHANEVGATQAANELLYTLATSSDPATLRVLEAAVIILIPSLNPDGHRLVVDWYNKERGSPFEGGPMPWLSHRYAGHDINRDAFMMNLVESRNLARFFYTSWHPQVFLTMHQMEGNGARFSAPPTVDPISPNYDPLIWREAALLGSAMTLELERDGRSGVASNAEYDYYWPGYEDSAPLGHNTVCLLTEVASVKVATGVTLPVQPLRDGERGGIRPIPTVDLPNPWPGGRWTLRNIVEYDLSAVHGLLQAVAAYREQIVQNFYDMGARAVDAGTRGAPFAFIVPPEQHDPAAAKKLEDLLLQSGVEIHRALEPFRADGDPYPAGTDIILLSQPYRAYVKTLLERQDYPRTRAAGGASEGRPYDVAGWTLPAQMGVSVTTIERTFEPPAMSRLTTATITPARVWADRRPSYYVVDGRGTGGALAVNRLLQAAIATAWLTADLDVRGTRYPAGSLVVTATPAATPVVEKIAADLGLRADGVTGKQPPSVRPIVRPRLALYRPWTASDDEGWTRWVFDEYGFRYDSLSDRDVRAGNLRARYDVIVLPNEAPDRIVSGQAASAVPEEYAGGLGEAGTHALKDFVEAGGTLVALDHASDVVVSAFGLPVRDVTGGLGTDAFFCPGSIVRIDLDTAQPLAYGMPSKTAGFFRSSSAFDVSAGASAVAPVRYAGKDVLLSGWLDGESVIAGRPAVVQMNIAAGHVVLLGFPVQHRAQSLATFRLLFNAILTAR